MNKAIWDQLYNLTYYFMIYSFIGWFIESSFKSLLYKRPINSGFLRGPFIPIYGAGMVMVVYCFSPFKESKLVLFALGFFFITLLEYSTAFIMEKMFDTRWWDYTGNLLNINGKVCIENSLYWGIGTIVMLQIVHPFINSFVESIPYTTGKIMLIMFLVYFFLDLTLSLFEVLELQNKVAIFEKIKDNALVVASTNRVSEVKKQILGGSARILNTYPKLTYLKINRKLRDVVNEIKRK